MRLRRIPALIAGAGLVAVVGCGSDQPLPEPLAASAEPTAAVATASPEPSPSPSPTPLSPFESDPAVVALRAYLAVSSQAINARNLELPQFTALATAARASRHEELYTEDLGTYYPGPPPTAVTGVRVDSATKRTVSICLLEKGFALGEQGGTPTAPRMVSPALVEMVLEASQWKVDFFLRDEQGDCTGIALPGDPA